MASMPSLAYSMASDRVGTVPPDGWGRRGTLLDIDLSRKPKVSWWSVLKRTKKIPGTEVGLIKNARRNVGEALKGYRFYKWIPFLTDFSDSKQYFLNQSFDLTWKTMFTLSLRLPWQGESTGVSLVKLVSNWDTSSSEVSDGSNGGFNRRLMTSDHFIKDSIHFKHLFTFRFWTNSFWKIACLSFKTRQTWICLK